MATHLDNEQELLVAARKGDQSAFMTLVKQYERNIYRLAMNLTSNQADAEDVMQEAFLKAFVNLHTFQGGSRFYTWLVRIAVNEALMKLRRRKTERSVSIEEPVVNTQDAEPRPLDVQDWGPNPEQRFAREELRTILNQALEKLPMSYRTVVMLRDVEGLSTEETAAALKLGVPAVKSRLLRGRLMLRESLNKHFLRGLSLQQQRNGAQVMPRQVAAVRRWIGSEEGMLGLAGMLQSQATA